MVLKGPRFAVEDFSEPHTHDGPLVQWPPGPGVGFDFGAEAHRNAEFLEQFAVQRSFECLSRFQFSAGELPHAGELRRGAATGNKQSGWSVQRIDDGGTRHAYQSSHRNSLWAIGSRPGTPAIRLRELSH